MDRVLGAIADPTRRAILARLAESDARITEVASAFPISLNSVSKHVRKLEDAGLLRRDVRGRDHVLSLNAAPLSEAAAWIAHYQRFWTDSLAALDKFAIGSKPNQSKEKGTQSRRFPPPSSAAKSRRPPPSCSTPGSMQASSPPGCVRSTPNAQT